jgi:UDP-N-acetylmuramate dehydrogenase
MHRTEHVPLSSLTTFKIGGAAQYVYTCETVEDIKTALTFVRESGLLWYVIGGGSNILASDEGFAGVIIRPIIPGFVFDDGEDSCVVTVGAGVVWDELVQESLKRGLWGLENLAGIPGLVGGAPVQNIGAYGADVSNTIHSVEAYDTSTDTIKIFSKAECLFEYRDSFFKQNPTFIITRVTFLLTTHGIPRTKYADLIAYEQTGKPLSTPPQIGDAVRAIRAKKFPDISVEGTAGSFFKNPTLKASDYAQLAEKYPSLPGFALANTAQVKVPLAWILDHVLHLRGYTKGIVRCFEQQPLVIVTKEGATKELVDTFASEIQTLVKDATGISIEKEVRTLV